LASSIGKDTNGGRSVSRGLDVPQLRLQLHVAAVECLEAYEDIFVLGQLLRQLGNVTYARGFRESHLSQNYLAIVSCRELYSQRRDDALDAIDCWSVIGRRCGVVKDNRTCA
jgi:hypothetical protein